jgi:hypothetical protein
MPFLAASAVQQLITDARVPGLSMAVIDDHQAAALTVVGVRNSLDRAAVDQQTIFAAASLSKPLASWVSILRSLGSVIPCSATGERGSWCRGWFEALDRSRCRRQDGYEAQRCELVRRLPALALFGSGGPDA